MEEEECVVSNYQRYECRYVCVKSTGIEAIKIIGLAMYAFILTNVLIWSLLLYILSEVSSP